MKVRNTWFDLAFLTTLSKQTNINLAAVLFTIIKMSVVVAALKMSTALDCYCCRSPLRLSYVSSSPLAMSNAKVAWKKLAGLGARDLI
jgi:hypothetical protein